jgi:FkbM family methyltransferase
VDDTVLGARLCEDRLRLFDVGARGGAHPRWDRFASCIELMGFEPDPAECERLNGEAPGLPYPARFLPHALWREARTDLPFYVCRWEVASGVYPPNPDFLRDFPEAAQLLTVVDRRTIAATTLDEVVSELGRAPDCLKLDAEGAELDILLGGTRALEGTIAIEVEVEFNPVFAGQPLFADVDAHLRDVGWVLFGLRRNSWRRARTTALGRGYGGQLVAGDALYVRRDALEENEDLERELKLLVVLAAYLEWDIVGRRLAETPALRSLSSAELRQVARELEPPPRLAGRIARALLRRVDSERRRSLADSLQRGDSTVWQDPHFF